MAAWVGEPIHNRLPPHVKRLLWQENFQGIDHSRAFAYDTRDQWATGITYLQDRVKPLLGRLTDNTLAATELAFAQKAGVCWRAPGVGRMVFKEPLSTLNAVQAAALRAELTLAGRTYANHIRNNPDEATRVLNETDVVVSSQKGAPTFAPGTDELAAFDLAAASRLHVDGKNSDVIAWCKSVSVGALILMLRRLQDARKPSAVRATIDAAIVETSYEAMLCKVREVKAVPFILNWVLATIAQVMKWADRATSPTGHGDIKYSCQIARIYKFSFASDMSSFDDTISLETLQAWHEEVLLPVLSALRHIGALTPELSEAAALVNEYLMVCSIICPPWQHGQDGVIVESIGRVRSGIYLTSRQDTDIRRAFIKVKARHVNLGAHDYSVFGDDAFIATDDPYGAYKWSTLPSDWLGFSERLDLEPSFLMRHIPEGYAYFCRQLFRTVNREPREEPENVVGAALGMRVRADLLVGHPLADHYLPILRGYPVRRVALAAAVASASTANALMQLYGQGKFGKRPLFASPLELQQAEDMYDNFESIAALFEDDYARVSVPYHKFLAAVNDIDPDIARSRLASRASPGPRKKKRM